jgi:hypothetical protein
LASDGKALTLPVANEEQNGTTENVAIWGVRVPESTYRAVENDKRDDGILQRNVAGGEGRRLCRRALPVMPGWVEQRRGGKSYTSTLTQVRS